jgi:hypothetical protein
MEDEIKLALRRLRPDPQVDENLILRQPKSVLLVNYEM